MQNFYKLSSAAQTAAYQLSEFSNYVSEAAKMADSVRMVSNQMKSIYQTAEWNNMAYRLAKDARLCVPEYLHFVVLHLLHLLWMAGKYVFFTMDVLS